GAGGCPSTVTGGAGGAVETLIVTAAAGRGDGRGAAVGRAASPAGERAGSALVPRTGSVAPAPTAAETTVAGGAPDVGALPRPRSPTSVTAETTAPTAHPAPPPG